jgi:hypothetical protein
MIPFQQLMCRWGSQSLRETLLNALKHTYSHVGPDIRPEVETHCSWHTSPGFVGRLSSTLVPDQYVDFEQARKLCGVTLMVEPEMPANDIYLRYDDQTVCCVTVLEE